MNNRNEAKMDTFELCHEADRILWQSLCNGTSEIHRGLVFPEERDKHKKDLKPQKRCSEQEARFAFVEALLNAKLCYSPEVPTKEMYNFTRKDGAQRAAMTDLVVYTGETGRVNIEFKSKGKSTKANHPDIDKDLEKLLREPYEGLWFHLLKNIRRKTIAELLAVFAESLKCVTEEKGISAANSISFHICVLERNFSLHKRFEKEKLSMEMIEREMKIAFNGIDKLKEKPESAMNGWNYFNLSEMKV